jgi:hypothetical protein
MTTSEPLEIAGFAGKPEPRKLAAAMEATEK